jgi:hypothetical protein
MTNQSSSVLRLIRRISITLLALLLFAPLGSITLAAASGSSHGRGGGGAVLDALSSDTSSTSEEEEEEEESEAEFEVEEGNEEPQSEAAEEEELEEEEAQEQEEEEEEEENEAEGAAGHVRHGSRGHGGSGNATAGEHAGGAVKASKLTLTSGAKVAIAHGSPSPSVVAFQFALSSAAKVHFTLSRELSSKGGHWQTLSSASASAARGSNHDRLSGTSKLAAGQYRLTLTPAGGHAQQLTFAVR